MPLHQLVFFEAEISCSPLQFYRNNTRQEAQNVRLVSLKQKPFVVKSMNVANFHSPSACTLHCALSFCAKSNWFNFLCLSGDLNVYNFSISAQHRISFQRSAESFFIPQTARLWKPPDNICQLSVRREGNQRLDHS